MVRPFPVDAKMTGVVLAFSNPAYSLIADEVLPITPTAPEFKHLVYPVGSGYSVPDTKVGRKSEPNEVEYTATEVTSKCEDYGLDAVVPNEDIKADNQGVDPMGTAVEFTTQLIVLAREIRVANLVFANATYPSTQRQTLSGTSQWSDYTNSNPVSAIFAALDTPLMRPNIATFGQSTWTGLRQNPKLVQAIRGTSQSAGAITKREFAEFFELEDVFVGSGFVNTAKKGQTESFARVWGKHAAFIFRDKKAGPQNGLTFGYTGSAYGGRFAGVPFEDKKRGLFGSQVQRVGEVVKEVISSGSCGYFFENAVA